MAFDAALLVAADLAAAADASPSFEINDAIDAPYMPGHRDTRNERDHTGSIIACREFFARFSLFFLCVRCSLAPRCNATSFASSFDKPTSSKANDEHNLIAISCIKQSKSPVLLLVDVDDVASVDDDDGCGGEVDSDAAIGVTMRRRIDGDGGSN